MAKRLVYRIFAFYLEQINITDDKGFRNGKKESCRTYE